MPDFDEPESLEELHAAEPYPCSNLIAELTHWVLESTRYPYYDTRRWECILHYFTLMKEAPILFTYYANIRVNVIAKISEIQEYMLEEVEFVEENRSLFTLLYYVMNDVLSMISHVALSDLSAPLGVRGDVRRKRTHGCAFIDAPLS